MQIREATVNDVPQLAELLTTVWQSSYQNIFPANVLNAIESEKWHMGLMNTISNPDIASYIAEENGNIVAMLVFGKGREAFAESEIYVLNVLPSYQRQGLGEQLMRLALNALTPYTVYLQVMSENHNSRRFYEKMGFKESGTQTEREMWGVRFKQTVYLLA